MSVSRGLCRRYSQVGRYRGSEECEAPAVCRWYGVSCTVQDCGLLGHAGVQTVGLAQFAIAVYCRFEEDGERGEAFSSVERDPKGPRECDRERLCTRSTENEAGKLKYRPYEKTDPSLCRPRTRNLPVRGGRRRGVRSVRASDGCG